MSGFSVQTSPVRPYYRVLDNHYHITLAEILTERHHISGHRIVRIWVHPEFRGRNLATILMNLLTNDADASVETLYFSPYICDFTTFDKTIPVSDQVKWLKKHGFKVISGKEDENRDGYCLMRRLVKNQLVQEVTREIGKHRMGWQK